MTGKYILRFPLCDRKLKIQCESQDRTIYQRAVFHARTTRCHNIVTLSPVQIDGGFTSRPVRPYPQPLSEWRGEWYVRLPLLVSPHPQPLSEWRGAQYVRLPLLGCLHTSQRFFLSRCRVFSLTEHTDLTETFCVLFNSWGGFSLTDLTDLTDPFCAQFRTHRTPPAYRFHRTLQPKMGVG